MVPKNLFGIILTFNTILAFLIFLTGAQTISSLASNSSPANQPIVSWFNFWNVMTVPYNYLYPSGTPIPVSLIARVYFPTYGFILLLIVNILFGLMVLRKTKEESTN